MTFAFDGLGRSGRRELPSRYIRQREYLPKENNSLRFFFVYQALHESLAQQALATQQYLLVVDGAMNASKRLGAL
jgi:hypothetical protein